MEFSYIAVGTFWSVVLFPSYPADTKGNELWALGPSDLRGYKLPKVDLDHRAEAERSVDPYFLHPYFLHKT